MTKKYGITLGAFFEGVVDLFEKKKLDVDEIYVPKFYVSYFDHLRKTGIIKGDVAINDLKVLKAISLKKKFEIVFYGSEPRFYDNIESFERETLLTLNRQTEIIVANDDEKELYELYDFSTKILEKKKKENPLLRFFDKETMSIHIKEGDSIYAKKGSPLSIDFIKLDEVLGNKEIVKLINEIIEFCQYDEASYIEKDSGNTVIAQVQDVRTVIVRPPLSEGYEITGVRPVKTLELDDYSLDPRIIDRINLAEGVLISGSPGSGKTTFCQAVAEHLADMGKIVKTIESPRDLQLSKRITQFSLSNSLEGDIANILLLSRPDYTIYDEMRNPKDLELYSDLRLTGIGMVGVIHATKPIDSIHRFIGKLELGMIPQVIDTIIFIKRGSIEKILVLESTVRVPTGMTESDLARPVIEIKDFMTNMIEYEVYTYGEQTVVIEVSKVNRDKKDTSVSKLAREQIDKKIRQLGIPEYKFEFESEDRIRLWVPENLIPDIVGRKGSNIDKIEKDIGIKISLEKLKENNKELEKLDFSVQKTKSNLMFYFSKPVTNVELYMGDDLLLKSTIGKKGILKIKRKSTNAKMIEAFMDDGADLTFWGY